MSATTTTTANPTFPTRKIGDVDVSAIGFGAMGLSGAYNPSSGFGKDNDDERLHILDTALALGSTYWDSADLYGDNELLLAKW